MKRTIIAAAAVATFGCGIVHAGEGAVPVGKFGRLDHVFLIMMENQTNTDILGSTNAPFINWYANVANQATNYFAVGHPSAPNYLGTVGGSNFGLTNDYWPIWINGGCVDNSGAGGCADATPPDRRAGQPHRRQHCRRHRHEHGRLQWPVKTGPDGRSEQLRAVRTYQSTSFTPMSIARRADRCRKKLEELPGEPADGPARPARQRLRPARQRQSAAAAAEPAQRQLFGRHVVKPQPGRRVRARADSEALCRKAQSVRLFRDDRKGNEPRAELRTSRRLRWIRMACGLTCKSPLPPALAPFGTS